MCAEQDGVFAVFRREKLGSIEIEQNRMIAGADNDIGWLDIAMDNGWSGMMQSLKKCA